MGLTVVPGPADILTAKYMIEHDLVTPPPPSPPVFRSRTTAGGPAGTSSPTIVLPSDIVAGDQLIIAWASFYPPGGDPPGWARVLLTTATGGANQAGVACWTKTAISTDAGATVHIPLGISSDYYTLAAVAYYNCSGVRSVATSVGSAGATSYATPASTALVSDKVVSVWLMEAGGSGGLLAFTLDPAVVERVRADWGGVINQFSHVGIGDETCVAGGATAPRTATWANSSSWASLTFILKPGTAPAPVLAVTDTFNRSNSALTLNPASDSGTWTIDFGGVFGITSNTAYNVSAVVGAGPASGPNVAIARRDVGQAAMEIIVDVTRSSTAGGSVLVASYNPATTGCYEVIYDSSSSFGSLNRIGNDGHPGIGVPLFFAAWTGSTTSLRLRADSAGVVTIYQLVGGVWVSKGTFTDTFPLPGTWAGFGTAPTSPGADQWDNFSAAPQS